MVGLFPAVSKQINEDQIDFAIEIIKMKSLWYPAIICRYDDFFDALKWNNKMSIIDNIMQGKCTDYR